VVQEVTQGQPKRCEVADESVVVKKSRPAKAGNRLEDKTGMTCGKKIAGGDVGQKPHYLRREEVYSKVFGNCLAVKLGTSYLTR
jgi:hypothetical protein